MESASKCIFQLQSVAVRKPQFHPASAIFTGFPDGNEITTWALFARVACRAQMRTVEKMDRRRCRLVRQVAIDADIAHLNLRDAEEE